MNICPLLKLRCTGKEVNALTDIMLETLNLVCSSKIGLNWKNLKEIYARKFYEF
jgi:hypothetical protein